MVFSGIETAFGQPFLNLHRPVGRNASLSLEITLQEKESQDAVLECAFKRPGSLSCNVILSEAFRKWNVVRLLPAFGQRLGESGRRLMHLVPAPAVRLMKRRVQSRPGLRQ